MAGFSWSIFFFPIAISLALQAQLLVVAQSPVPPLIVKACEQSLHKDFCIDLLKSDRSSQKADLRGLAYIALRVAEKNATSTSLFIKQTLDKTQSASDGISECSEHYLTAVELIEDSISSLVSDGYNDVTNFAKAAVADLDTCDISLQLQRGVPTAVEVANQNRVIRQLINTALSIAHVAASANVAVSATVASSPNITASASTNVSASAKSN